MLCTFDFDVVTAVCQLLINGYVMLCYVNVTSGLGLAYGRYFEFTKTSVIKTLKLSRGQFELSGLGLNPSYILLPILS